MASVYFRSLEDAEILDVRFLSARGRARSFRLLVDSGFTGPSSVILSKEATDLVRAQIPAAQATGALRGVQQRGWVTCRIPGLNFQATMIAIFTDLFPLSLPAGVQGMAGLTFLRHFKRWGATKMSGEWHFVLSDGKRKSQKRRSDI